MIDFFRYDIDNGDYSPLEDSKFFNVYYGKSDIKLIADAIKEKCKVIELEYPYYDSDYLSNYYHFHVKKFKSYSKKCLRMILFANKNRTDILGYITFRPMSSRSNINRVILEPIINDSKDGCYIMVSPYKIHYKGGEAKLKVFPQMGQEIVGEAVCAHVSIWAIMRYFSNKFHRYPELPLGYVSNFQLGKSSYIDIDGCALRIEDMAEILRTQGYIPLLLNQSESYKNGVDSIIEEMYAYLESGFPLIGVNNNNKHAFVIVGVEKEFNYTPNTNNFEISVCKDALNNQDNAADVSNDTYDIVPVSSFYRGMIVNDDHHLPYRSIDLCNIKKMGYSIGTINSVIVPLYDRISLTYYKAKDFLIRWIYSQGPKILNWNIEKKIYYRIFLTSHNTYKEYIIGENIENKIKNDLMRLETSKLVWCVEIYSPDGLKNKKVDYIMLLDSTSSRDDDSIIIYATGNKLAFMSNNKTAEEILTAQAKSDLKNNLSNLELLQGYDSEVLNIEPFNNNLHHYDGRNK